MGIQDAYTCLDSRFCDNLLHLIRYIVKSGMEPFGLHLETFPDDFHIASSNNQYRVNLVHNDRFVNIIFFIDNYNDRLYHKTDKTAKKVEHEKDHPCPIF